MKTSHRASLSSRAALAALLVGCPATAWAQDAATDDSLGEIVVTARRVAENIQRVPISVAAVDEETLESRGIKSITDIKSAIANVTISKVAVAGGNYISIRGITGTSIPNVTADSNIGLYLDGIYLARTQSSGGDIADLERIELLRGPQGTLSGRNSAAGAINFVTASPTGEFGVIAEGTVGNYGRYRGRLTVNTPEFSGFSARFTYVHDQNNGSIPNLSGGKTYNYGPYWGTFRAADRANSLNSDVVMAKIRYEGIENLTVDYKFDFSDQWETFFGPAAVGFNNALFASIALTQTPGTIPMFWRRPEYLNQDMLSPAHIRTQGHTLTMAWDINDALTAKSITGYRTLHTLQQGDVDGLALPTPLPLPLSAFLPPVTCISCSLVKTDQKQFSQELQLIGRVSDKLKYILGGYYFWENAYGDNSFSFVKNLAPVNGIIPTVNSDYSAAGSKERAINKSYAVYGHIDYSILENLELALGARYTIDDRATVDERPHLAGPVRSEVSFNRFNYDVALTYSVTPDIHLYGRYATGYQSGGIMKGTIFRPEEHKALEFGMKSELFDRKVRLNASYYHTKVKDLQRAAVNLNGLIIENYADATINGVEVEMQVVPVRGLTIGANYGYNKLSTPSIDVPLTPRTTFAFNAQYDTVKLQDGIFLSFRIDGDYRSKYYGSGMLNAAARTADPNLPPALWAGYASPQAYVDDVIRNNLGGGYWMANARVSVNDIPLGGAKARVTAFARNIADTEGRNYTVYNGAAFQTSYEQPLTYGLELGIAF